MNSKLFDDRVALVTGAARGMGRAIARALADRGASVMLADIQRSEPQEAIEQVFGSHAHRVAAVTGDVTNSDDVRAMVAATVERFGGVDVLVNNAGVLRPSKVVDITVDEWDLVVDVNLKGTFLVSQAVVPHMRKNRWGRIINVSSTAGKNISTVGGAHYTAAKAGVLGFTRHLANEVAADGITVNAVCPGLIDTDMVRTTISPEATDAYARGFPIPRLGEPEEVADLVAFLASDNAAYITGASVDINGGDLMI